MGNNVLKDARLCVDITKREIMTFTVRNRHYCLLRVLQGSTYVIARAPIQKSINGRKVRIEPSEPYRTATLAIFNAILAKQGTSEGF